MSRAERCALVEREDPALPVSRQCRLLAVSRASVYRQAAAVSDKDLAIMALIDRQYLARPYYGSRRMAAWLAIQGHPVNRKRVQRLMRLIGLVAVYQRPNTSKPAAAHKVYPYLLGGLSIDRVNQVWCSDITYIPMAKGFVYLVAIMDWHSRAVLAWRLSNTLGADFCVEALEDALAYDKPEVFNTDQGCQFTGIEFTSVLEHCGITISRDGKGRCMDNIFIERLWRSLKYEEVYLHAYASVAEATAGIGNWFRFYNEERQHQSHGYRTPRQVYEAQCRWICGRSALPPGSASPASRASSKSREMLAFAHIPTGTTTNTRIDQKAFEGTVTSASMAIGADIEIRGATP
jgi:putative transposase